MTSTSRTAQFIVPVASSDVRVTKMDDRMIIQVPQGNGWIKVTVKYDDSEWTEEHMVREFIEV